MKSAEAEAPTLALSSLRCTICDNSHDEILEYFVAGEVRRIVDGDLSAEVAYVKRELADDPGEREPAHQHRLRVLEGEVKRRRRIAAKGGPLYRGRTSIPQEKIAEIKRIVYGGSWLSGPVRCTRSTAAGKGTSH